MEKKTNTSQGQSCPPRSPCPDWPHTHLVQIGHVLQAVDVGGEERGVGWHAYRLSFVQREGVDPHAHNASGVAVVFTVIRQPLGAALADTCVKRSLLN